LSTSELHFNLIGGEWVECESKERFESRDPADTRKSLGFFQDSGAADVDRAATAAKEAFPAWRDTMAPERGAILQRAAELMDARGEELARRLTAEEGKRLAEAQGEVERSVETLRYYAGAGRRLAGKTLPNDTPGTLLYTLREPVGVAGIITPWNFPQVIPVWKLAPALVAGNTVVFKPSTFTPRIAIDIARVLVEAGLPPGVLNLVTGGAAPGQAVVEHPDIGLISFTGHYTTGKKINELAAPLMKRVQLEMGGKNPIVVMDDADLDTAVSLTMTGGFLNAGQVCTSTSRVIVHEKVHDTFMEKLLAEIRGMRVTNGMDPDVSMGPLVSDLQKRKTMDYIAVGKDEAELATGGGEPEGGDVDHGYFVEPTVFTGVTRDMRIAKEEIFGPVLAVMKVGGLDEAIAAANDIEYGLSASICTRDIAMATEFTRRVEAGVVKVNNTTAGLTLHAPFGGIKHSSSQSYKEQGDEAVYVNP